MSLKLLIDECLSPELVELAVQAGYLQSTCVRDRGWSLTTQLIFAAMARPIWVVTTPGRPYMQA